jgi:hypothetical protein
MAEARYTGLWLAQQAQAYEEPERFTVEPPPDPAHAASAEAPAEAQVMQRAPIMQGGGEIITDAIIEERDGRPPADTIDRTPTVGPGASDTPPGGFYRPSDTPPQMALLRGLDLGAPRRATGQRGRPFQFPSEQYFGLSIDGSAAPPITHGPGDDVLRRGLNAYPENDGPGGRTRPAGPGRTPAGRAGRGSWRGSGWNLGRYQPLVTNVQRNFKVPNRTHRRFRVVHPDIAAYVGDSPPATDRYSSPFSRLQRFGLNFARTREPGMRRSPGPWDEAIVAGAPTVSGGVSVDGLVIP